MNIKKGTLFYSHLISLEKITIEVNNLHISKEEKEHLLNIASSNIHFAVLDVVLSHLPSEQKETFLEHVENDDHKKIWEFLKEKVENAEEKIIKRSEELLEELLLDIAALKK